MTASLLKLHAAKVQIPSQEGRTKKEDKDRRRKLDFKDPVT